MNSKEEPYVTIIVLAAWENSEAGYWIHLKESHKTVPDLTAYIVDMLDLECDPAALELSNKNGVRIHWTQTVNIIKENDKVTIRVKP